MMRYGIAFFLLGVFAFPQVYLDKRIITLGEEMTYQIFISKIKVPAQGYEVREMFKETGNVVVLSVTESISALKGLHRKYTLTSFEMEHVFIPTISIRADKTDYIFKSIPITVTTTFTEGVSRNAVLEFKPQANIALKWWNYLLILLVVIGIYLVSRHLLQRFGNHHPEEKQGVRVDPLCAKDEALRRLSILEESSLWLTELKAFYFELSTTMKAYLSSRLGYPFLEETTFEIRQSLPRFVSHDLSQSVYNFFVTLDPVKYAHHLPSASQSKGLITLARELIDEVEKGL